MKISHSLFVLLFTVVMCISISCTNNKRPIPKPPTYLRMEFPDKNIIPYKDDCGFSFEIPDFFNVDKAPNGKCNRDISFGSLNGTLHLSVIQMDTSLAAYIDYALSKVDEHKVKATAIYDSTLVNESGRAGGTLFALEGNVASPFQFYITDSTDLFLSGVVYFNARPNFDSLKPVLEFVEPELFRIMETLTW